MKKFLAIVLAAFSFVAHAQVSAAASDRKARVVMTPDLLVKILNTLDGLPCGGCSISVQVADIEDLGGACHGCARHAVPLLPEAEVSCNTFEELRTFVRAEWQKKGQKKATRLVLTFDLPDMVVTQDQDGYSVVVGSLTISLPKNIVEVIVRADEQIAE